MIRISDTAIAYVRYMRARFHGDHDGTTPEIKKIGRSIDGGGSGLMFFKIILF